MKQVESYQERGTLIDQGNRLFLPVIQRQEEAQLEERLTPAEARGDRLPLFPSGEEAGVEGWKVFEVRACY